MPFFVVRIENDLDRREARDAVIHQHHEYLKAEQGRILMGGAFLDDAEEFATGALYIIEADSLDEARSFANADPLTLAETRKSIAVSPWCHAVIDKEYVFGSERAGATIPGQREPQKS